MHLSAMPPGKSDLSTHLGITIRWSVPTLSYFSVTSGPAKPTNGNLGAYGGQLPDASQAGGVAC